VLLSIMHAHMMLFILLTLVSGAMAESNRSLLSRRQAPGVRPNIVFLIVESVDGRTFREGSPVPLPHIRKLQKQGVTFDSTYSAGPVCCPSRAALWSGRHVHKIPHRSALDDHLEVSGAWNGFEGLPSNYNLKISDLLRESGYDVRLSGKSDWSRGGHSLGNRLEAWTMYTAFPYKLSEGGWSDEATICAMEGEVRPNGTAAQLDWDVVDANVGWIRSRPKESQTPFFLYQGMNIVHPPYVTNTTWLEAISEEAVDVPEWAPLEELHPCDLQSSMLKGCIPSTQSADAFYAKKRRRRLRRIYYATIAEFDAMVGRYVDALQGAELWNDTVLIVTSDHGDMNQEHQQFYKMVPYDASSRVPLVISSPMFSFSRVVTQPSSLLDICPTILDLAGIAAPPSLSLDGYSLAQFLQPANMPIKDRPPFVVSQFHGCDIAMSWFMVRQGDMKFVTF